MSTIEAPTLQLPKAPSTKDLDPKASTLASTSQLKKPVPRPKRNMMHLKDLLETLSQTYARILAEWEAKSEASKHSLYQLKDLRISLKNILAFYSEHESIRNILKKTRKNAKMAKERVSLASLKPLHESSPIELFNPQYLENLCVDFQVSSPRPDLAFSILTEKDYLFLPGSISNEFKLASLKAKTKRILVGLLEFYVNASVVREGLAWEVDRELCTLTVRNSTCEMVYVIVPAMLVQEGEARKQIDFPEKVLEHLDDNTKDLELPFHLGNINAYLKLFCLLLFDLRILDYVPKNNLNVRFSPAMEGAFPSEEVERFGVAVKDAKMANSFIEKINCLTVQVFNFYEQIFNSNQYSFLDRNQEVCLDGLFDIYNQNYLLLSQVILHLVLLEQFVTNLILLSGKTDAPSPSVVVKISKKENFNYILTCSVQVLFDFSREIDARKFKNFAFSFDYFDLKKLTIDFSSSVKATRAKTFISELCRLFDFEDHSYSFTDLTQSLLNWFDRRKGHLMSLRGDLSHHIYYHDPGSVVNNQFTLSRILESKRSLCLCIL